MSSADRPGKASRGVRKAEQPAPDADERERITKAVTRMGSREPPPRVSVKRPQQGGPVSLAATHSDQVGHLAHLVDTFGTRSIDTTDMLLSQLASAVAVKGETSEAQLNGALAAVHGIAPQDEAEAMLAVQMGATHTAALNALRRAQMADNLNQLDSWSTFATKLLRTYSVQLETLAKYRRRGAQTVRVEHVHVAPGAQAIVGPVTHVAGGGGQEGKGDQPPGPGTEQRNSDDGQL